MMPGYHALQSVNLRRSAISYVIFYAAPLGGVQELQ